VSDDLYTAADAKTSVADVNEASAGAPRSNLWGAKITCPSGCTMSACMAFLSPRVCDPWDKILSVSSTESPLRPLGTARPRHHPTEAGIAILEVLVAGVLLSIALVGIALMFSLGRTFVLGQGDQRVALYLAEQQLETLRTRGHDNIQAGSTTEAAGTIAGFPHFIRVTTVTALPDSDGSGFAPPLQLTVTVTSTIKAADQTVVTAMLLYH
jgi:type II secretory pathway pseudopilin PulG